MFIEQYTVFTCTLVYKTYTSSLWVADVVLKTQQVINCSPSVQNLLAFFIYFSLFYFLTFFQPPPSPPLHLSFQKYLPFITLFTGQSRDLQSHVTSTLCIPSLVGVTILILPAFINNISSNLSCPAKIQTAC